MDPSSSTPRGQRGSKPRKKPANFSVSEMADLLGVNRGTLTRWLEIEGCPFVSRPDVPGGAWELAAADVIEWYVDREAKQRVEKAVKAGFFEADEGIIDMPPSAWTADEAKRRKAIFDALIRQIDLDKASRSVTPNKDVTELVTREYGKLRESLSGVGAKVSVDFGADVGARTQELIEKALAAELKADRRDWSGV